MDHETKTTPPTIAGEIIQEVKEMAILYNIEFSEALTAYQMAEARIRKAAFDGLQNFLLSMAATIAANILKKGGDAGEKAGDEEE